MNRSSALRDAVAYVLLTYLVSWTLFGLWATVTDLPPLARTALFVGGGFGPMAAAVVLVALRGGSLREWLARVFRVRLPARYYLFALVLPVVAVLVAGGAHVVLFGGVPTPGALPSPVEYPLFLALVFLLGGGQEEPGWRGYLLPRLQSRYGALAAALAVGVVWGVWHVPLFLAPDAIQSGMSFPLYLVQVVSMSVVLTWLTNAARESVLPAMLLHAGANAVVNYYPVGGTVGGTSVTGYGLLTATVVVVALWLVVRSGGRLGTPSATTAGPTPADD